MADNHLEARLELSRLEDLFQKPDITPLSPDYKPYSYTSGIEYIAGELYADSSLKTVSIHLAVADSPDGTSSEDIKTAIKRYTEAKLRDLEQDHRALIWRGWRVLGVALLVFAVAIGLSIVVKQEGNLATEIIATGLSIAGWVALWFPLEMLSFEIWQLSLDRRIYRHLAEAEVVIEPAVG